MKVFSEGYPSDFLRIASSFWVACAILPGVFVLAFLFVQRYKLPAIFTIDSIE